MKDRIKKQIEFITEVDKLKKVIRQSYISDGSRKENDTEHSWHLALMTMILAEHANEPVDVLKVMKMVIIHDIVEIDAGDTYAYDEKGNEDKYDREVKAAERIFGLLPEDQCESLKSLWEEFEARQTIEAKFAAAIDRVQPILLNYLSDGRAWKEHGISKKQVLKRNQHTMEGSSDIWSYFLELIDSATEKGYLREDT